MYLGKNLFFFIPLTINRMLFNTYYINMDKDISKNTQTIEELSKTDLSYQRFSGVDSKRINKRNLVESEIISPFCNNFCTDKTIGCGVSHIALYKHIQEHDKNDFALILEDDILVSNSNVSYQKEINAIVEKYNNESPQWQIIRLHSMGLGFGSNAAEIINLKHISTFSNMTLHYHIDIQQSFNYHIINLNTLFDTRDHLIEYTNKINNVFFDNQKIGFYMNNHIFKLFDSIIYFSRY